MKYNFKFVFDIQHNLYHTFEQKKNNIISKILESIISNKYYPSPVIVKCGLSFSCFQKNLEIWNKGIVSKPYLNCHVLWTPCGCSQDWKMTGFGDLGSFIPYNGLAISSIQCTIHAYLFQSFLCHIVYRIIQENCKFQDNFYLTQCRNNKNTYSDNQKTTE